METRLAQLEVKVDHLDWRMDQVETKLDQADGRLRRIEIGLATLVERVAHLPSKGFIISGLVTGLVVIAALVAFQAQIQMLLHIVPPVL